MIGKSSRAYFCALVIAAICARGAVTAQYIRKSSATTTQKNNADAPRKLDVSFEYTLVNTEKKAVDGGQTQSDVIATVSEAPNNGNEFSRIVGGDPSEVGEFPYFVDLGNCAGTLIAPTVVLTAGHCNPKNRVDRYITVGASNKKDMDNGDFKPAESIRVVDAMTHPKYGNRAPELFLNNDFGLLLLEKPYIIESDIKLVLNDQKNVPASGTMLDVIGMGSIEYGTSMVEELRKVAVPAISNNECEEIIKYDISKKQMCAGQLYGGKDACQGDSGGPLIMQNGNEHILVGLTSWGINCGKFPGVYARVSEVLSWIEEKACLTWQVDSDDLCGWVNNSEPKKEQCQDKENFTQDNPEKDCDWVAKQADNRCNKKVEGRNKKYKYFCEKTCGKC